MRNDSKEIEKLLKLAAIEPSKTVKHKKTDVDRYVKNFKIRVSLTETVPSSIIYYHYAKWRPLRRDRLSRSWFFRYFSKFFEGVMINRDSHYRVDPELYDLSQEGILKAKVFLRKERYGKKKSEFKSS